MATFCAYLLHEHQRGSYTCLESYQVEAPDEGPVRRLEQTALDRVKSHGKLGRVKSSGTAKFEIYQCLEPLQGRSSEEKEIQVVDAANRGDLESYWRFYPLDEDVSPKEKASSDLIIVFRNLRFDFVIFENRFGSYDNFGSRHVTVFPSDLARKIHDTARSNILELLCGEDPDVTYTITSLSVHEVKVQYKTDYQKALDGELQPHLLKGGFSAIRRAEDNVRDLETSNLVVLFTATRKPRERSLRIPYVLFNRDSCPYLFVGQGYVDASSEDTVGLIHDVVRQHIEAIPTYWGKTGYFIYVYEPKEAFQSAYNKRPDEVENLTLENETFFGGNCFVLLPRGKLSDWREGQTLIVVFGISAQPQPPTAPTSIVDRLRNMHIAAATRERSLRIPYVLFSRESGSYRFVHQNHIDASSEDTARVIHDVIRQYLEIMPAYGGSTGYFVDVYEPKEAFQSAYNKQLNEMKSLRLEDETFSWDNCSMFLPQKKLSDWREGQTLITVFGIPAQPRPPTASTSIVNRLRCFDIVDMLGRPLMMVTKCENYEKFQEDAEMRIPGGPPIAPTPLLFQPFGYFRDILRGVDVPGQGDINDVKLWQEVDELVDKMIGSHKSEEDRRSKFIAGLEGIFGITPRATNISNVLGGKWVSDGHVDEPRRTMVFCMVCKNELFTTCEPTAQLVTYIASPPESRGDQHPELFKRWRVPVLGVTYIGHNVQFVGVIWMGTVRVVPLTPLLSMMHLAGEEFRWDLFLAFKAACIVLAEIQTHAQNILQAFNGPDAGWPPVMIDEISRFPSITEIDIEAGAFPGTRSEKIKFILESRHDNIQDRWLYHARLVSPTSSDKGIYVKFSQRYSVELHRFCAERGLAPRILGFQELHGGWFVVAMEKIDTENPNNITAFPEAVEWKKNIEELVSGFHQKGFVHGDLRMANFVFTKSDKPRRMILIDFDWGGKDGEVEFPHEELIEGLGVSNKQLCGRKIRKEHDLKCFEKVVEWLDLAVEYESLRLSGNLYKTL